MVHPVGEYILVKKIEKSSEKFVITPSDIEDTVQKGEVVAISKNLQDLDPSEVSGSTLVSLSNLKRLDVGDVVIFQKHADADTPDELKSQDLYLIQISRIMAIDKKEGNR